MRKGTLGSHLIIIQRKYDMHHNNIHDSKIIVDITDTIRGIVSGRKMSGIPRVLTTTIDTIIDNKDAFEDVHIGFYDQIDGIYCIITEDCWRFLLREKDKNDSQSFRYLKHVVSKRACRDINQINIKYQAYPVRRILRKFRYNLSMKCEKFIRKYLQRKRSFVSWHKSNFIPIQLRSSDVIVIIGASWSAQRLLDFLESRTAYWRPKVVVYIHDIIPLIMKDDFPEVAKKAIYDRWFRRLVQNHQVRFLTSSYSNSNDIEDHFCNNSIGAIGVVPLPHEHKAPSAIPPAEELPDKFVLYVGSLIGRKNGSLLVEIWEQLIKAHDELKIPNLCITDSRGWIKLAASTKINVREHITFFNDLDDSGLAYLYQNALFTVFISQYEGWGLPVGESLWYETPCVASNSSAIPEVGGDMCLYVDQNNKPQVLNAIETMIFDDKVRQSLKERIQKNHLRSWRDFAMNLIEEVREVHKY